MPAGGERGITPPADASRATGALFDESRRGDRDRRGRAI